MDGGALSSSRQNLDGRDGQAKDVFERLFASPLRPVKLHRKGRQGGKGSAGGSKKPKQRSRSVDPEKLYARLYEDRSKELAREKARRDFEAKQKRDLEKTKVRPTTPPPFVRSAVEQRRTKGAASEEHSLI